MARYSLSLELTAALLLWTYGCTIMHHEQRGVLTQLLALRTMVSDWTNDTESRTDYKDYKRREVRVAAASICIVVN
jgi:hypothetical protein